MHRHGPHAVHIVISVEKNAGRGHCVTNGQTAFGWGGGNGQLSGRDSDKHRRTDMNKLRTNQIEGTLVVTLFPESFIFTIGHIQKERLKYREI